MIGLGLILLKGLLVTSLLIPVAVEGDRVAMFGGLQMLLHVEQEELCLLPRMQMQCFLCVVRSQKIVSFFSLTIATEV